MNKKFVYQVGNNKKVRKWLCYCCTPAEHWQYGIRNKEVATRTKIWLGDFLEKFPDSPYNRFNTEVDLLEIGFVDVNRIKLAKTVLTWRL
jgi:hypothetical protein